MSVKEAPEGGRSNLQNSEKDRRWSERFPFSAIAEVMDRQSGTRMAVRIADISREGCYADALNGFPTGAQVILTIRHADLEFKTPAMVIYALPRMGMGMRFKDVAPEMSRILEKWITEARGELNLPFDTPSTGSNSVASQGMERRVLYRLLELLMRKSLVSQTEGSALIEELLRER
jgi:hypothetical protein